MKKLILYLLLIVSLSTSGYLYASPKNNTDSAEIVALVKSVYKQELRAFLRIHIKEPLEYKVKYYERFFTPEVSRILAKTIVESEARVVTVGPFYGQDPRYGYDVMVDIDETESDWYEYIPTRKVRKVNYHSPIIKDIRASIYVDTLIKNGPYEQRSIYYLEKTNKGWRISNIVCGPREELEKNENDRRGPIYSIIKE